VVDDRFISSARLRALWHPEDRRKALGEPPIRRREQVIGILILVLALPKRAWLVAARSTYIAFCTGVRVSVNIRSLPSI